jgi:hypothetical protein
VIVESTVSPGPAVGSIPVRPVSPVPTATLKDNVVPDQLIDPNDEALRPSSQANIWLAVTRGTPRAFAEASSWSLWKVVGLSVCMLAVKAP